MSPAGAAGSSGVRGRGADRLEQYIGKSAHQAPSTPTARSRGSVKAKYATGKHSSGLYAEGKHAAIARAHGSMDPPHSSDPGSGQHADER